MAALNAITNNALLSIVEWGESALRAPVGGETAHVLLNVADVDEIVILAQTPQYTKVVASAAVAMTAAERMAVNAAAPVPALDERLLTGAIFGLHLTAFTDDTVTVSEGCARCIDDNLNLVSTGDLVADITASGAGGLDTGAVTDDTWYSVWLIGGIDDTTDVLLSLSETAPTMPGTYYAKRRIGWVCTDGTDDILPFTQLLNAGADRWMFWHVETNLMSSPGASDTFAVTPVSAATVVPPTAIRQDVFLMVHKGNAGETQAHVEVIPDGWNEVAGGVSWKCYVGSSLFADFRMSTNLTMPVSSTTQIIKYRRDPSGGNSVLLDILNVMGYQDAL